MSSTSAFRELDLHWREELSKLHDDYFHGDRSDSLWREHATRTLPVLQEASNMLVCGEDLGMIPACVHPVMEELGIIGLRIQRMPSEPGVEFADPGKYSYMTVASPSSHDTSTLRAWYEGDDDRREQFFLKALGGEDSKAPEKCTTDIAAAIIRQHMESPSMLAIFALQDLMALSPALASRPAEEETINDPTNPEHYWRYRMHVTLETLIRDDVLSQQLQEMVAGSGRSSAKKM
jgi:4-alpha-glucanotransferase